MAGELEGCKPLSGLLSGLAQEAFHGPSDITEELLRSQLYPDVPSEEFRPFLAKMRWILKVPPLLPPLPGSAALPRRPKTRAHRSWKRLFSAHPCSTGATLHPFRSECWLCRLFLLKGDPLLPKLQHSSNADRHLRERRPPPQPPPVFFTPQNTYLLCG